MQIKIKYAKLNNRSALAINERAEANLSVDQLRLLHDCPYKNKDIKKGYQEAWKSLSKENEDVLLNELKKND